MYVCGTHHLHCTCASNGIRELHHSYYIYQWKRFYSTAMVLRNDYGFSWIYLPGPWMGPGDVAKQSHTSLSSGLEHVEFIIWRSYYSMLKNFHRLPHVCRRKLIDENFTIYGRSWQPIFHCLVQIVKANGGLHIPGEVWQVCNPRRVFVPVLLWNACIATPRVF